MWPEAKKEIKLSEALCVSLVLFGFVKSCEDVYRTNIMADISLWSHVCSDLFRWSKGKVASCYLIRVTNEDNLDRPPLFPHWCPKSVIFSADLAPGDCELFLETVGVVLTIGVLTIGFWLAGARDAVKLLQCTGCLTIEHRPAPSATNARLRSQD